MRILLLSITLFAANCYAETSVWRVNHPTDNTNVVYIGGTLHILESTDYPLPSSFSAAYTEADTLVFETDLAALSSADFQIKMLSQLTYSDGSSLKSTLNNDTYQRLSDYCLSRGFALSNFLQFKPPLLTITLTMIELQRLGISSAGVDEYFHKKSSYDNKAIAQLETPEQQLNFLAAMGQGQENQLVLSTLNDMDNLADSMSSLKSAWREGNSKLLLDTTLEPMQKDYPQLYQDLLVTRNNNWLPKIESMLTTPETEFILVGALHLVGKDGIIERLQEQGYQIEQL